MNKKLFVGLAPIVLALPLAMAPSASAVTNPGGTSYHLAATGSLTCGINAYATRRGNIRVSINVDQVGPTFNRRTPLVIRVTDNSRIVAGGRVWTRLPFPDSGTVGNLSGPDRFTLTAYNPNTGKRCWDSTTVLPGSRSFNVSNDWVASIM